MERRGRGGGEGAGRMRSRDWYWALVGLWVRPSHDEEKMRADFFMCWNIWCGNWESMFIYKVLLASDQSTFGCI